LLLTLLSLFACNHAADDTTVPAVTTVPWSGELPELRAEVSDVRGFHAARALIHMHSPFSHDACDGAGYVDGVVDQDCLADLRHGLCASRVDVSFFTDHPAFASEQEWAALFHPQPGDEAVVVGPDQLASRIQCEDGHKVLWMPGIEDELMPVALDHHVADSAAENDRLYNGTDLEAIQAEQAAGGFVLQAHTEGKSLELLLQRQQWGLSGVEIFNLHAMFDPNRREQDLGLDRLGWITDIAPFTNPNATGEPDLFFLGVHGIQQVSIDRWNALLQNGPMVATAGTDGHQNVLLVTLRDGDRGDSYRRVMRWFANTLLVDDDTPQAYEAALRAGRSYITYHLLGVPTGFDFHAMATDGTVLEMGSSAEPGVTISLTCPTLSEHSPRGEEVPVIEGSVWKDGVLWQSGCGEWLATEPGAYQARVDITPHHLKPFLGEDPAPYLRPFPWVQSNAIRLGLPTP